MLIEFPCDRCGRTLLAPVPSVGKNTRCPQCAEIVRVHAPAPIDGARLKSLAAKRAAACPPLVIGDMLAQAWRIYRADWGQMLLVGFVYLAVSGGVSLAASLVAVILGMVVRPASPAEWGSLLIAIHLTVTFFVRTWLRLAMATWGVSSARTGRSEIGRLAAVGRYYMRGLAAALGLLILGVVGAAVFVGVPVMGGIVFQSPTATVLGAILGGLALLVAAIWVGLSVFLYVYLLVDRNERVIPSFRLSIRFMEGNRIPLFALMLLLGLAGGLIQILTCTLGQIVVAPYVALVRSLVYLAVTGQPHADSAFTSPPIEPRRPGEARPR